MTFQYWVNVTSFAFQRLFESAIYFIPNLLAAIVIIVIGWFISVWLGRIIAGILQAFKFNSLFKGSGWNEALDSAELNIKPADFLGNVCKWVFMIMFLTVATDIVGWTSFTMLLNSIIQWIPNLVVAIAIMVVAIVMSDILEKIVRASTRSMGIKSVNFFGSLVRWAIFVFAIFAVLIQLGIAVSIVNSLAIGIIATITLALGISFGLGGKEAASEVIREMKHKLKK
jgi:small-conductance mechanosensitive channel